MPPNNVKCSSQICWQTCFLFFFPGSTTKSELTSICFWNVASVGQAHGICIQFSGMRNCPRTLDFIVSTVNCEDGTRQFCLWSVARIGPNLCVFVVLFRSISRVKKTYSCNVPGLRGLLELDPCGELWCRLNPHAFTYNMSSNDCYLRCNSVMSLWCEKSAHSIFSSFLFVPRNSPRIRSDW